MLVLMMMVESMFNLIRPMKGIELIFFICGPPFSLIRLEGRLIHNRINILLLFRSGVFVSRR